MIFSQILYFLERHSRPDNCEDYDRILNPLPLECGYFFMGNELIYYLTTLISLFLLAVITILIGTQSQVK